MRKTIETALIIAMVVFTALVVWLALPIIDGK